MPFHPSYILCEKKSVCAQEAHLCFYFFSTSSADFRLGCHLMYFFLFIVFSFWYSFCCIWWRQNSTVEHNWGMMRILLQVSGRIWITSDSVQFFFFVYYLFVLLLVLFCKFFIFEGDALQIFSSLYSFACGRSLNLNFSSGLGDCRQRQRLHKKFFSLS